jgi:hypothetical protein
VKPGRYRSPARSGLESGPCCLGSGRGADGPRSRRPMASPSAGILTAPSTRITTKTVTASSAIAALG